MAQPAPRLDVLFLTHNFPRYPGDFAGRFIERFAKLLVARGLKIGVVAPHHAGSAEFEEVEGIPVWRFRYGSDEKETLAYRGDWRGATIFGPHGLWAHYRFFHSFGELAASVVRDASPRVIHAHWWIPAGWVARPLAAQCRLIVTTHGSDVRLLQTKSWMRPLAAQVFKRATMVTAVSTWLAGQLQSIHPMLERRLDVAPMPAEESIFTGVVRSQPNSPPVILCVTRYTAQKRNDVLLRALDRLRSRGITFHCRLVGEGGSERDRIHAMIEKLGLTEQVHMIGGMPQSTLADEYRRADVTVLPAVDEGFGLALVEAQLCGCAVVGARSGGITDIISDEQTGLLVNSDDAESLAGALHRILTDNSLRIRLAESGQASARAHFSSRAITDRFLKWYQLG